MATHSSVFAWRIPGMGEPGGLPSMGLHRVGHDWSDAAAAAAAAAAAVFHLLEAKVGQEPISQPSFSFLVQVAVNSSYNFEGLLCNHCWFPMSIPKKAFWEKFHFNFNVPWKLRWNFEVYKLKYTGYILEHTDGIYGDRHQRNPTLNSNLPEIGIYRQNQSNNKSIVFNFQSFFTVLNNTNSYFF